MSSITPALFHPSSEMHALQNRAAHCNQSALWTMKLFFAFVFPLSTNIYSSNKCENSKVYLGWPHQNENHNDKTNNNCISIRCTPAQSSLQFSFILEMNIRLLNSASNRFCVSLFIAAWLRLLGQLHSTATMCIIIRCIVAYVVGSVGSFIPQNNKNQWPSAAIKNSIAICFRFYI